MNTIDKYQVNSYGRHRARKLTVVYCTDVRYRTSADTRDMQTRAGIRNV